MDSSALSFNDYYTYSMYIAIFGVVICILVYFWPTPEWVKDDIRISEKDTEKKVSSAERRQALFRAILLILLGLGMSGAMIFIGGFPVFFSAIISVALIAMVYPTVNQIRERQRQKTGRREALAVAEFVAGRMSAQAPLFEALENLFQEFTDGKRDLDIIGEDLGEMIRGVRLGNELDLELMKLKLKYENLNSLRYIFTSYQLMVEAEMGQEAEIYQATDLSEAQTISDELASTLETEMSTATMSRITMFLLIGGMILFLVFFGEGLGDVLVNTIAGNAVLGFSLFSLYLAQTIGSRLEELPALEF